MHENADMTSAMEQAEDFFFTILKILPKAAKGVGKSREEQVDELAVTINKSIPDQWEMDTLSKKYPTKYTESMNTVLVQVCI
jgi:dynein heavy chain